VDTSTFTYSQFGLPATRSETSAAISPLSIPSSLASCAFQRETYVLTTSWSESTLSW